MSNLQILVGIGIVQLLLAYPSAYDADLIGLLDLFFGSGMQVVGSGLAIAALTWGLGFGITRLEWIKVMHSRHIITLFSWMKWAIPLTLLLVLIGYIYSAITGI